MPVEPLDLKQIWNGGKSYADWLAVGDAKHREEMERITAEVAIPPETAAFLKSVKRPVHVLAIAENWCGDVRRNVPAAARICAENPDFLRLRCVPKEAHPQLIVRYLTNA